MRVKRLAGQIVALSKMLLKIRQSCLRFVKFEDLASVKVNVTFVWNVTPYNLVARSQFYGGRYWRQFRGRSQFCALKMKASGLSETLVYFYPTVRSQIPEEYNLKCLHEATRTNQGNSRCFASREQRATVVGSAVQRVVTLMWAARVSATVCAVQF
jgi:hypothetical protein